MKTRLTALFSLLALLAILAASACAPAAPTARANHAGDQPHGEPSQLTQAPKQRERSPHPTLHPRPAGLSTVTAALEPGPTRLASFAWSNWNGQPACAWASSDVLRLALVPSADGYTARAEFDEHPIATDEIPLARPPGYILRGVARLDGPGFEIAPAGDQARLVPAGETVTWRWSLAPRAPGRQRLSVSLLLRWEPEAGASGSARVRRPSGARWKCR